MNKFLLILLLILLVVISGCSYPGSNWVYKTNGDYYNFIHTDLGSGSEIVLQGSLGKTKLNKGYVHEIYSRFDSIPQIVFLNKTIDQWNQGSAICDKEAEEKLNQLRIEKCGSLNFDIFVECTSLQQGGEYCSTKGNLEKESPRECKYTITTQESDGINACEDHIYSSDMVIDSNPFTEFFYCPIEYSVDQINSIIDSDKLSTDCKKMI